MIEYRAELGDLFGMMSKIDPKGEMSPRLVFLDLLYLEYGFPIDMVGGISFKPLPNDDGEAKVPKFKLKVSCRNPSKYAGKDVELRLRTEGEGGGTLFIDGIGRRGTVLNAGLIIDTKAAHELIEKLQGFTNQEIVT